MSEQTPIRPDLEALYRRIYRIEERIAQLDTKFIQTSSAEKTVRDAQSQLMRLEERLTHWSERIPNTSLLSQRFWVRLITVFGYVTAVKFVAMVIYYIAVVAPMSNAPVSSIWQFFWQWILQGLLF